MAMQSFKSTGVAKMPKVKAKPFRDGVKPVKRAVGVGVKKTPTTARAVRGLNVKAGRAVRGLGTSTKRGK